MINQFIFLINKLLSNEEKIFNKRHSSILDNSLVVSLLFQEIFGGEIYKVKVNGASHYINSFNENIYDVTDKSLNNLEISYDDQELMDRKNLLENDEILKIYQCLKKCYEQESAKVLKINDVVHNCKKCGNNVENFKSGTTMHFGINQEIVILGEAPANNGWRKSGKVWYDLNNNLLPSGKIMQKLLDEINYNLLDISFLEAIKCYPKDRKVLDMCKKNCVDILNRQIEILNPKIVLSLGDTATKAILDIKYSKFSDVVGCIYEKDINGKKVKIIPIYHPSPISPLSYKGNIPIFKKIKELL